ncbi:NAD(P)-binding protein [Teratosphaeria destructans]|uniref:NAD(P)-binding protein n=1 Tax=Teratosphaeria destructans TaxID=418781 RepID=A0A9W7W6U4_9PEZI|nr:NAD(P)-binding protein [Teratosphaeria destructans]
MPDQTKYTQNLKDKKVLIIGGSSGIGFCTAEALVEHGAVVTISSSNPDRVNKTLEKLKQSYPSAASRISGHPANFGDIQTIEENLKTLLDAATKNGKLDHIIWTAGDALATMKLESIDIEKVLKAGAVRFFGPMFLSKYAKQYLNAGPQSSITLTTGAVSERPNPDWSVVNSYATGLQGMTRGFALDLAPIRVNLVSPGAVETELWDGLPEDVRKHLFESYSNKMPTGRIGQPEHLAETYVYLLKDENISGSMISSNGGVLLK